MERSLLERFARRFSGGEQAYGEWSPIRGARTIPGPVPLSVYEQHLDGQVGLGVVPVKTAGVCLFAAIDIDDETINHQKLYDQVVFLQLPLNICRSKSGGAHLYLLSDTEVSASHLQPLLKRWAGQVGYPRAELFPKQLVITPDNTGSWINLPYYGGDDTTRYAFGPGGALSLEAFLATAKIYDQRQLVPVIKPLSRVEMPPCLEALAEAGLGDGGGRNNVLFNVAVFYRKSSPTDWEDETARFNQRQFKIPLNHSEVQAVIRSITTRKYQYTCRQSPIQDHCDREKCETLEFGVANKPWHEPGAFDTVILQNLRKILTNPPRYVIAVNGKDLDVSWEELSSYRSFKSIVGQNLNLMMPGSKNDRWDAKLKELLDTRVEVEAPEDASFGGLVLDRFHDFLGLKDRSDSREDVLKGMPVQENVDGEDVIFFRLQDFRRYLQGFKLDRMEPNELFMLLATAGCQHIRLRINGRLTTLWSLSAKAANLQTEEFQQPTFVRNEDEEI